MVGIGSVGTRCWVVLLRGRNGSDPLFVPVKEAQQSAVEPAAGRSTFGNQGQRVVEGQRLMQAGDPIAISSYLGASDAFDRAIAAFAEAYADQNERDDAALAGSPRKPGCDALPGRKSSITQSA